MDKIGIDKRIRHNLIRLRLEAGLTQNGLSHKSGVAHIGQIESGRKTIGKGILPRLADALNVDISAFFIIPQPKDTKWETLKNLYSECSPWSQRLLEEIILTIIKFEKKNLNGNYDVTVIQRLD